MPSTVVRRAITSAGTYSEWIEGQLSESGFPDARADSRKSLADDARPSDGVPVLWKNCRMYADELLQLNCRANPNLTKRNELFGVMLTMS
jgi:hypothetical protein